MICTTLRHGTLYCMYYIHIIIISYIPVYNIYIYSASGEGLLTCYTDSMHHIIYLHRFAVLPCAFSEYSGIILYYHGWPVKLYYYCCCCRALVLSSLLYHIISYNMLMYHIIRLNDARQQQHNRWDEHVCRWRIDTWRLVCRTAVHILHHLLEVLQQQQ